MKDTVTIKKSDLKKLGKILIKEIDNFLHDDYIVKDFPELQPDRENFDDSKNRLKDKFESLSIDEMYHIFVKTKLDDEIDGDLFYKKEAYLYLFNVFCIYHSFLDELED